jgi:hypothetical protein
MPGRLCRRDFVAPHRSRDSIAPVAARSTTQDEDGHTNERRNVASGTYTYSISIDDAQVASPETVLLK